jgi:RNA polymerase sigma-B factor
VQRTIQKDERELFTRLRAAPTPANREEAVKRYLPLARGLAARYSYSVEPAEDLQQVAAIGLLNAIDRFDPDRGAAFTSYAIPTILGELRRHFRDRTWALRVPRSHQELTVRMERARDELATSLGRHPTIAELSRRLDVDQELILQLVDVSTARRTLPLTRRPAESEDAEMPGRLDDGYRRVEDRAVLTRWLESLSARDAQIVLLRYSADLTQDAIARRLHVSQMSVSRALRRSLARFHEAAEGREERTYWC